MRTFTRNLFAICLTFFVSGWLLPLVAQAQLGSGERLYKIINRRSGLALEIGGYAPAPLTPGATANQWPYNGNANQQWLIKNLNPGGQGYFIIVNRGSGQLLEASGESKTAGARITQHPFRQVTSFDAFPAVSQQWQILGVADGSYMFMRRDNRQVLEIGGSYKQTVTEGQVANQWPLSGAGTNNQQWALIDITDTIEPVYTISNLGSSLVLEANQGDAAQGATVQQGNRYNTGLTGPYDGTNGGVNRPMLVNAAYQEWYLREVESGWWAIINRNSGQALEIGGSYAQTISQGHKANQWPYSGNHNQQWAREVAPLSGQTIFRNRRSGYVLQIGDGRQDFPAGTMATQGPYLTSLRQEWSVSTQYAKRQPVLSSTAPTLSTKQLSLYPNPAHDLLFVRLAEKGKSVSVTITDARGSVTDTRYQGNGQVDVASLAPGLYVVTVSDGQREYRQKFLKE